MATDEAPETSRKRARTDPGHTGMEIVKSTAPLVEKDTSAMDTDYASAILMDSRPARLTAEFNPLILRRLEARNEIGFRRLLQHRRPDFICWEIDIPYFRECITDVLTSVLRYRYHHLGSYRSSEIEAEIKDIVPFTVDLCMSALYAKLRNIHKAYGSRGTRYSTSPLYTKDIELPLPFALAIEQFGAFETHALIQNVLLAPTYPEGVLNEGRLLTQFSASQYLSYVPTFKELGIPCKMLDTRLKAGTAWWTYRVRTIGQTTDLVCTLPASHYSDLSADLRLLFLSNKGESKKIQDIIHFPNPFKTTDYGTRDREERNGANVRTFLALCHGPEEEWLHGD